MNEQHAPGPGVCRICGKSYNDCACIPHEITMTRAELQEAWDASSKLCARLQEALEKTRLERDDARTQNDAMRVVMNRIAALNRDAGEIGPGMLASLVDDAKWALSLDDKNVKNALQEK